jgi:hypothetical protein
MSNPTAIVYGLSGTSIVRIAFDKPMTNDNALIDVSNYTIYPASTANSVAVVYKEIKPENKANPTYVDVYCTEMTIDTTYNLDINSGSEGPTDFEDNHIDPGLGTLEFLGTGTSPTIKSVEAILENQAKITFSEVMDNNLDIRNKDKYSFDNGLQVLSVESVEGSEVVLKTSEQTEGILYKLTISLA